MGLNLPSFKMPNFKLPEMPKLNIDVNSLKEKIPKIDKSQLPDVDVEGIKNSISKYIPNVNVDAVKDKILSFVDIPDINASNFTGQIPNVDTSQIDRITDSVSAMDPNDIMGTLPDFSAIGSQMTGVNLDEITSKMPDLGSIKEQIPSMDSIDVNSISDQIPDTDSIIDSIKNLSSIG